jgi:indolepyruvate ferredoxin oxidoreductase beta subunit
MHAFDMAAIAEATGSVISAVLFGTVAGAGVLPFPRQAFEGSIKRGGVGVKASLAAFTAGFEATTGGAVTVKTPAANLPPPTLDGQDADEAPSKIAPRRPLPADLLAKADAFPESARAIIRAGIARTADYQGLSYAQLYLDRLAPIAKADKDGRLTPETARQLALGMTYEDTIRVAELKIRPSRFERVRADVSF